MPTIIGGLLGRESSASKRLGEFRPSGFAGGGLAGRFDERRNQFLVSRTREREEAIGGVVSGFRGRAQEFGALRERVRPGFGGLSEAIQRNTRQRLTEARLRGETRVGGLRSQLARRRVQGSSFARAEVEQLQGELGLEEDRIRAEAGIAEAGAFIQEIDLTSQLIGEEFASSIQGAQTVLENLNLEAGVAAELGGLSSQLLQANLTARAEAQAASEAGAAEFLGSLAGLFLPTDISERLFPKKPAPVSV